MTDSLPQKQSSSFLYKLCNVFFFFCEHITYIVYLKYNFVLMECLCVQEHKTDIYMRKNRYTTTVIIRQKSKHSFDLNWKVFSYVIRPAALLKCPFYKVKIVHCSLFFICIPSEIALRYLITKLHQIIRV